MALVARASGAIAGYPAGVGITCHQAVWFWAAEETTAQGLVPARTLLARMETSPDMPGYGPGAMLRLPRVSAFDFNQKPATPPQGTVLLWLTAPTHSAVVTPHGISGYNQGCIFPQLTALGNYSSGQRRNWVRLAAVLPDRGERHRPGGGSGVPSVRGSRACRCLPASSPRSRLRLGSFPPARLSASALVRPFATAPLGRATAAAVRTCG